MDSGRHQQGVDDLMTTTTNNPTSEKDNPKVNVVQETSSGSDHPMPSTTARSYDCTYCKRGFTTAQALGGHMNIHRRDRARNRESNVSSSPAVLSTTSTASASAPATTKNLRQHHHDQEDTRLFFPSESSSSSSVGTTSVKEEKRVGKEYYEVNPDKMQELIKFGKELELGLKETVVVDQEEDDHQNISTDHGEEDNIVELKLGF